MARIAHTTSWLTIAAATAFGCAGELDEAFQPIDTLAVGGAGGGNVQAPEAFYRPDIQIDLQAVGCIDDKCHGDTGVAMVVTANPASGAEWQYNYAQVRERGANGLLMTKPTGAFDHPVESLPGNSPILAKWSRWVADGMFFTDPNPDDG